MEKRIYEMIDGSPKKILGVDYWKEKFLLQIEDGLVFNPFAHLTSGCFSFIDDGKEFSFVLSTDMGIQNILITKDDEVIIEASVNSFYDHYKMQEQFWYKTGIPLVHYLMSVGILSDADMRKYCSVLFFPPVIAERTWEFTLPRNNMSIYEEQQWLVENGIIEPTK